MQISWAYFLEAPVSTYKQAQSNPQGVSWGRVVFFPSMATSSMLFTSFEMKHNSFENADYINILCMPGHEAGRLI